jgi:hypothetical protein
MPVTLSPPKLDGQRLPLYRLQATIIQENRLPLQKVIACCR